MQRVDKPWGHEIRFVCTDRYAGKILFIKAGSQLSLQYHEKKDEAFIVQDGTLELVLGRGDEQRVERLEAGESRHITGQIVHALQNARKAPGQERIYVAGEKEYEAEKLIQEQGVPVNPNLRQELQAMRDELDITGYETFF